MRRKVGFLVLLAGALALIFAGCGGGGGDAPGIPDGGSDGTVDTSGTVRVLLTDAPSAHLAEVWVSIVRVELVPADEGPIVALESGELPGQFELLSLAGNPLELGVVEAPVGAYDQVRLILADDGHAIVDADGNEHDLRVPSGVETGVKVNFPDGSFEVLEGQTTLLLDFLAGPSVHMAGQSGQWIMRPVINGSTRGPAEPAFGAFEGTVAFEDGTIPQPVNGYPPAVFLDGDDAHGIGEIDPETGAFEIPSVLAGDYELEVGRLGDEGEMVDGELSIVIDEGALEDLEILVEPGATLAVDITVRVDAGEEAENGDRVEGGDGDEVTAPEPPSEGDADQPPAPPTIS